LRPIFYFLIFAQFAFLKLLQAHFTDMRSLRVVMGIMAVSGIVSSLLAAWLFPRVAPSKTLHASFIIATLSATAAPFANSIPQFALLAGLIGIGLGGATVTLAAILPQYLPLRLIGQATGLGTGLAYAACNIPPVFTASASTHAWATAVVSLMGIHFSIALHCHLAESSLLTPNATPVQTKNGACRYFWILVLSFFALIWFDSAAFFTIQNEPALKAIMWQGDTALWANVGTHFLGAVLGGIALGRGKPFIALIAAYAFLVCGLFAVRDGWQFSGALYCAGVSFYSAALVGAPSIFARADLQTRVGVWWKRLPTIEYRAALLYGIAGWIGSAMGIGMAQDLQTVPLACIVITGAWIAFAGIRAPKAERLLVLRNVLVISSLTLGATIAQAESPAVHRGKAVYISEGCINCHSQYIRPGNTSEATEDALRWGPSRSLEEMTSGAPPLIGNRRNGPDLLNIGNRRSAEWLKIFLKDPQLLRPGAVMPRYAQLFSSGQKGDDLVAYLSSLGAGTHEKRRQTIADWKLPDSLVAISPTEARTLYGRYCSQCHGAEGFGNGSLAAELVIKPRNLREDRFIYRRADESAEQAVARVIKFGTYPTSMPGQEYFPDREILGLARLVLEWQKADDAKK
jgi:mono/diheme cytochrome c family protein